MASPFHFMNLLTQEECQQNLATLDQLSERWTPRLPGIPFYTLGAPAYMDASEPNQLLKWRVLEMNPLLEEYFSTLLAKVRSAVESYLDAPIFDLPGASLPGFHIFGSSSYFTQSVAGIHFDLQYQLVAWPEPPALETVVSFTLPLALPKHGGGLNWWHVDFKHYQLLERDQQEALKKSAKKEYLPYEEGKLVLHNGHILHQIASASLVEPSDRRVTLQGHAARAGGKYYWYW